MSFTWLAIYFQILKYITLSFIQQLFWTPLRSRLEVRHREYGSKNGNFCPWPHRAYRQVGEIIKQGNTETLGDKGTYSYGDIGRKAENSVEVGESTPKEVIVKLKKMRLCYSRKIKKKVFQA